MSKYSPLADYLRRGGPRITLTFEEIAELLDGLPSSAYRHREWWANPSAPENDRHVQARAWLRAGRTVEAVDLQGHKVWFSARS